MRKAVFLFLKYTIKLSVRHELKLKQLTLKVKLLKSKRMIYWRYVFNMKMDHLNGKLFVDYLSPLKRQRAREKVEKVVRQREKQKVPAKR